MIPTEIQGYIRHILHSIGVLIVTYGGFSQDIVDVYVGLAFNLLSLGWFGYATYIQMKAQAAKSAKRDRRQEAVVDSEDETDASGDS